MAAKIKEKMTTSAEGVLDLSHEEDIYIEVDGFVDPKGFRELFAHYHGKKVKIGMALDIEYAPEV